MSPPAPQRARSRSLQDKQELLERRLPSDASEQQTLASCLTTSPETPVFPPGGGIASVAAEAAGEGDASSMSAEGPEVVTMSEETTRQ